MPLGDIGAVIDSYEYHTTEGLYPHLVPVSGDVYAIVFNTIVPQCRIRSFEISIAGAITEPYLEELAVHADYALMPAIHKVIGNVFVTLSRDNQFRTQIQSSSISPAGAISDTILDYYNFAGSSHKRHAFETVVSGIFTVIYCGGQMNLSVQTIQVDAAGDIKTPRIDVWDADTGTCFPANIIKVYGNIYVICYAGTGEVGKLLTFPIAVDGTITKSVTDSLTFDATNARQPDMCHLTGEIYAIAYTDTNGHGKLATVSITDPGAISDTVIDTLIFDSANCYDASIVPVGTNIVAIAYKGTSSHGLIKTVAIDNAGNITDPPLASGEFDDTTGTYPSILHIAGHVYAIAYAGPGTHGWLKTISITTPGAAKPHNELIVGIGP